MIANDGTTEPGARHGRRPRARQAKAVLGGTFDAGADGGSSPGAEGKTGLAAGLPPAVPRPIPAANQTRGRCSQEAFTAARATATLPCPAGERLTFRGAPVAQGRPRRDEATSACSACPRQPRGPRNQGGRRRTRWGEPPFGPRKRWGEQGVFWRRGGETVRPALRLTAVASNRRRVLTLVGRPRLRAALGAVRGCGGATRRSAGSANAARHAGRHEDPALTCGNGANWSRLAAEGVDTV